MDALAGYGSDSNSEEDDNGGEVGGGGLSGLLGHYSDDDSDDDNHVDNEATNNRTTGANGTVKPFDGSSIVTSGKECGKDVDKSEEVKRITGNIDETGSSGGHTKKRRRRWDNPKEDPIITSIDINNVLPPPSLLGASASTNNQHNEEQQCSSADDDDDDAFQSSSSLLFQKDYTKELRQKLSSQQLQDQSQNRDGIISKDKQQLTNKLEQLRIKFHQSHRSTSSSSGSGGGATNNVNATSTTTTTTTSSFAAHLKSQKEFGNPHLLKSIIEHYSLSPLGSHVGNSFEKFEYVDRLVGAEERARIVAADYNARMGGGGGGGGSTATASGS